MKQKRQQNLDDDLLCPAGCGKFFQHTKGLSSHLAQARSCRHYCRGKNRQMESRMALAPAPAPVMGSNGPSVEPEVVVPQVEDEDEDPDDPMEEDAWVDYLPPPLYFLPASGDSEEPVASSSQLPPPLHHTALSLDDDEDTRVEDVYASAGKIIDTEDTLHKKWTDYFKDDTPNPDTSRDPTFSPFASELDWRVAQWAMSSLGHNKFNELLAIPGVRFSI